MSRWAGREGFEAGKTTGKLVKRATVAPKVKTEVEKKGKGMEGGEQDKCGIGESGG